MEASSAVEKEKDLSKISKRLDAFDLLMFLHFSIPVDYRYFCFI